MKTLTGYIKENQNRADEAISKGVSDMDAVIRQMRAIVGAFNSRALRKAEEQVRETKKYLETANDRHVTQIVEDWMKKKGYWYATEVEPGSKDWWDLFYHLMDKAYKYGNPWHYEVIKPDKAWEDKETKEYESLAKKIAGIR